VTAEIAALVDRCLLVAMTGTQPSPKFLDWLHEGLGGVNLFHPNIRDAEQLAGLCAGLRAEARTGLLLGVNAEGGDVTPLYQQTGSPHPGGLALGAVDDPQLTRSVALDIGNYLATAGVNLNMAPVADVNIRPDNTEIGARSYGADPDLVARHVVAYVGGLQSTGVAGSAKHFPGHGSVPAHADLAFPAAVGDIEPHLVPFRAAIAHGVATIQTAHVTYPTLDSRPATVSRPIVTDLLRGRLGFDGVVITDALSMAAIVAHIGLVEAAVQALAAGADLLCMSSGLVEQRAVRDGVVAAVVDGRLAEARLVEAAGRVDALVRAYPEPAGAAPRPVTWTDDLGRRLLHVDAALPLPAAPYVIEFTGRRRGMEPGAASLLTALQRRDSAVTGVRLGTDVSALALAVRAAAGRPLLLVAADVHQQPRVCGNLVEILRLRPDAVLVGLGTTADAVLAPGRYLGTRGSARPNLDAAARCLLG
jgi:beta-N-acetylhexosaminidase